MALVTLKSQLSNYYNGFAPYNKRTLIDPNMLMRSSELLSLNPVFRDFNTNLRTPNRFYGYDTNEIQEIPTNLKSLKFGKDQPGGGNSGLPYIKTSINVSPGGKNLGGTFGTRESVISTFPIFTPGSTGNLDYPIRGGQVNFQIGQQTFTVSNEIDRYRIASFMKDPPRGTAFIQKQIGLQLTNPKIETQPGVTFGIGQNLPFAGNLENTRIYNQGRNTLAQVSVMGTGAHGIRHGTLPFNAFQKAYYYTVNQQNIDGDNRGSDKNRLVILAATKMTEENQAGIGGASVNVNKLNSLGISLDRRILLQYLGGPGSTYGLGSTTIYRTVDTAALKKQNPIFPSSLEKNYIEYSKRTITGINLAVGIPFVDGTTDGYPLQNRLLLLRDSKITGFDQDSYGDYEPTKYDPQNLKVWGISKNNRLLLFYSGRGPGAITRGKDGKMSVDKENTGIRRYEDTTLVKSSFAAGYNRLAAQTVNKNLYDSIDQANNKGVVTSRNRDIQDYKAIPKWSTDSQDKNLKPVDYRFYASKSWRDKMNKTYPFWFKNDSDPWNAKTDPYASTDDMIKFVFEAISNNNTSVSTALFFRAHLNGTITDNNTAAWNSFKYFGRGENFYTYQGFERTMNFSFRMYASSQGEMRPMYNRLNNLISQVYPDYSSAGVMRAPIIQLTVGDYIRRMPGILENVNVTINNETSWEVIDDAQFAQLPHLVDVNVSFKPILTTLPRRANSLNTPYMPSIIANKPGFISQTVSDDGSAVESRAVAPAPNDPSAVDKDTVDRATSYIAGTIELQEQQRRLQREALLNVGIFSQEQREKIQNQYNYSKKFAIEAPKQFGKAPNPPIYELENKFSDPNDY